MGVRKKALEYAKRITTSEQFEEVCEALCDSQELYLTQLGQEIPGVIAEAQQKENPETAVKDAIADFWKKNVGKDKNIEPPEKIQSDERAFHAFCEARENVLRRRQIPDDQWDETFSPELSAATEAEVNRIFSLALDGWDDSHPKGARKHFLTPRDKKNAVEVLNRIVWEHDLPFTWKDYYDNEKGSLLMVLPHEMLRSCQKSEPPGKGV